MASQTIPYITPEEYLQAERKAEFKSEYCDGQVYAMAGGRPRHTGIASNILARLAFALRGGPCRTFNSDMRVHIPATGFYTYPDVSVVCGTPVFFQTDNLVTPIVIVEVLSSSTQRHDRTTKFLEYRSIPSLREYLMVSQEPRSVTHCTRIGDEEWRIETVGEEQGVIRFPSIGVELPFDEIYADLDALPG
jgi:Uma2 family endonuclease